MDIVVSFKKVWGKCLFYPVSKDAKFITRLTGRPTILKHQLKTCQTIGWNVSILKETILLEEVLQDE